MSDLGKCNVCEQNDAVAVGCSSLGAVSFAYCHECAAAYAEPYGLVVGIVAMCGGLDECAPWVAVVAKGTTRRLGKTLRQFYDDVAAEIANEAIAHG
jgi:hypothetical protein